MKIVGDRVYIQRGEIWSLDFELTDELGRPYMLYKDWTNPYLAITVTAARYEQLGDFRKTYWLDLSKQYVEQDDGTIVLSDVKRFVLTEPLYLDTFDVEEVVVNYTTVTMDNISDFLFYTDLDGTGNYAYKYYNGSKWVDYSLRIVKRFVTKDWMEQNYLYDMKILTGDTLEERVKSVLGDLWVETDEIEVQIEKVTDENEKAYLKEVYMSGAPLLPTYDTKSLILMPTEILVSANIQGGVR